jgi:hypothetical protein
MKIFEVQKYLEKDFIFFLPSSHREPAKPGLEKKRIRIK